MVPVELAAIVFPLVELLTVRDEVFKLHKKIVKGQLLLNRR